MEFLLAALSLGFLGSFHCVGMCGPIALALPLNKTSKFARVVGGLIYNSGRILTYSLLGIIFGLLGKSFVIAGYQQLLSIVLGVLILLIVFLPESAIKKFRVSSTLFSMVGQLKSKLASLFQQKNYTVPNCWNSNSRRILLPKLYFLCETLQRCRETSNTERAQPYEHSFV